MMKIDAYSAHSSCLRSALFNDSILYMSSHPSLRRSVLCDWSNLQPSRERASRSLHWAKQRCYPWKNMDRIYKMMKIDTFSAHSSCLRSALFNGSILYMSSHPSLRRSVLCAWSNLQPSRERASRSLHWAKQRCYSWKNMDRIYKMMKIVTYSAHSSCLRSALFNGSILYMSSHPSLRRSVLCDWSNLQPSRERALEFTTSTTNIQLTNTTSYSGNLLKKLHEWATNQRMMTLFVHACNIRGRFTITHKTYAWYCSMSLSLQMPPFGDIAESHHDQRLPRDSFTS